MATGFTQVQHAQEIWFRNDLLNLLAGMEALPVPKECEYAQGFHDAVTVIARMLGYERVRSDCAPSMWMVHSAPTNVYDLVVRQ